MLASIKNVYCVGRNYKLHAAELGNAVPTSPMFFTKPTHALVEMNDGELELPADRGEIHYEAELVVKIGENYDGNRPWFEHIDGIALGIDFTLRDVQNELKQQGHPWLKAKGFKGSAPITQFIPFPGLKELEQYDFTLNVNEVEKQRGNVTDMIFSLESLIVYCEKIYGLGPGDIIFTGTPAGVGSIRDRDQLKLNWADRIQGGCIVKLN